MELNDEFSEKVIDALRDENLMKTIGGLSPEKIRKNAADLGINISESKSDDEIISKINSNIKKIKKLDEDTLKSMVDNFISGKNINIE